MCRCLLSAVILISCKATELAACGRDAYGFISANKHYSVCERIGIVIFFTAGCNKMLAIKIETP